MKATQEAKDAGSTFFFVNKNASNLKSKDPREAFSILSHAQREQYKRAREESGKELKVKFFEGRRDPESKTHATNCDEVCQVLATYSKARLQPHGQPHAHDLSINTFLACAPSLGGNSSSLPSPVSMLNPGNSDPFNASIVPINPLTNQLAAIAAEYHASLVWPMETFLGQDSPAMKAWWDVVRDNLGDEACMASFLGYAAALKMQVHPNQDEPAMRSLKDAILRYKTLAITSLRSSLAGNAFTLSALVAVMRLMCIEAYTYNSKGAKLHFYAATRIVEGMGGLSELPWLYREYLFVACTNFSTLFREYPKFPVEGWDPGPFSKLEKRVVGFTGLEEAMKLRRTARRLDPTELCGQRLGLILEAMREVLDVEEIKREKWADVSKYWEVYRWAQARIVACRHRLCTYYLDLVGPLGERLELSNLDCHDQEHELERRIRLRCACACVAAVFCEILIFYQSAAKLNRWNTFGPWEETFLSSLNKLIHSTDDDKDDASRMEDEDELHLLLWGTCMVAIVHRMLPRRSLAGDLQYRDLIRCLMKRLGMRTNVQVKEVCSRLLWSERIMADTLSMVLGV